MTVRMSITLKLSYQNSSMRCAVSNLERRRTSWHQCTSRTICELLERIWTDLRAKTRQLRPSCTLLEICVIDVCGMVKKIWCNWFKRSWKTMFSQVLTPRIHCFRPEHAGYMVDMEDLNFRTKTICSLPSRKLSSTFTVTMLQWK